MCTLVWVGGGSPHGDAASMEAWPGTCGLGGVGIVAGAQRAPLAEVGGAVWNESLRPMWDLNTWLFLTP